jgi:GNAT superfamily N-acetyltransferase
MIQARPDALSLSREDPRDPAGAALVGELIAVLDALYPEDAEEDPAPWTMDTLATTGAFVVARLGGEVAGCGGLVPVAEPAALEIVRMYVRPAHRGRRIADQLLAELETLARDSGVGVLMLRCGPRQPEALRFYERNGYTPRPVFAHHREHPTNVFYEKRLARDAR